MSENLKGYKAFELGLICRGKQYAENTIFEEDNARICHSGMHFCKNPLAVLDYYPLVDYNGKMSEFAEVEALDECFTDDNEKYCTKKLKIGAKISFPALVQASVNFEFEKDDTKAKTKRHDKDDEKISSKTNSAKIGSSGNFAQIGSSGYSAQIGSSGDFAQIGSSGNYAQIDSTGLDSVICCAGRNSRVKAKKGSWITIAEWEYSQEKGRWIPKCVKTEYVDGERIKEDTFNCLENGEFKESE